MKKLGLNQIREEFLSFFESKNHLRLKSASLVPQNDKSLLLINSGMAPLKPYFTGQAVPPNKRVTTCQKCIRTPDIERVGKTARHGTFFEMLGNFSFGNYFKKEAIAWAWEFCTVNLNLPVDKLWVTIYLDDDEAFEIWNKEIGVHSDRIVRMGKEDNFWEHGLGPCGPCSEIYFDRGESRGCGKEDCRLGCECDRFIEFWNLVFTQFDKDEAGNYNLLENPNIDTGMGLERMAVVMQDVDNLFEVDTVKFILDYICQIAGVKYGSDSKIDTSIRVITDHARSVTFMTSDGILPSNEGRGYVLRRLLRRAARHGKLLGLNEPFLNEVAKKVIEVCNNAYPELEEKKNHILSVIEMEEKRFNETIDQGLSILQGLIENITEKNQKILSGENAFKLYDTYGFPLDLTKDVLEEQGLSVDEDGFKEEMQIQRERARAARASNNIEGWKKDFFAKLDGSITTKFIGYKDYVSDSIVKAILSDNEIVKSSQEGEDIILILDKTPFYAESGGQISDIGKIYSENFEVEVYDCKKVVGDRFAHYCRIIKGEINVNDQCRAEIDKARRMAIARNHSSTHLLHKALRNTLGDHVEQAGSYVTEKHLRFDFSHFKPISESELAKVEEEVNKSILDSLEVSVKETDINEAKSMGAMALFGEKYGDVVRVVKMGNYSTELCGGTHLSNTSQARLFKIVSEGGIAAGVRRIEAITGYNVYEYLNEKEKFVEEISLSLKTSPSECIRKIEQLNKELKENEKELLEIKSKIVVGAVDNYIQEAKEVKGVKYIVADFENMNSDELRNMGDRFKDKLEKGIIVLTSFDGEKITVMSMATKSAVASGIHSGNLIKEMMKLSGGSGGGRPDMAQGGLKDKTKLKEALNHIPSILEQQIK